MKISVIIPSRDEGEWLLRTVNSILSTAEADGLLENLEIIVVDDGSNDESASGIEERQSTPRILVTRTEGIGPSRARNCGAALATGDVLLFSDAHVEVPTGCLTEIVTYLENNPSASAVAPAIVSFTHPDRAGYGLTWSESLHVRWLYGPSNDLNWVPLLPGAFLAIRRMAFDSAGGFDAGLTSYGHEDEEISIRLWLLGYQLHVIPTVKISHLFREAAPYPSDRLARYYNILRLGAIHFSAPRLERLIRILQLRCNLPKVVSQVMDSDTFIRRKEMFGRRVFDDDWYVRTFRIPF